MSYIYKLRLISFQESVEILVAMFAGEIVCGGAWTVGVIILRREDTDTFRVRAHLFDQ